MLVLLTLISFYFIVLLIGKFADKVNYLGYLFIGFVTLIEVACVYFLLYIMEVPSP